MNWRTSQIGWLGLVAYVVAWDFGLGAWEGTSLTYGFQHVQPYERALLAVVWGITTLHLFGALPKSVDPFIWAGHSFGRTTYVTVSAVQPN